MSDDNALPDAEVVRNGNGRTWRRLLGAALLLLSISLAIYLLVAYLGWQSGQALLGEKQQTELSNQINRQINLAQENINQGSYGLAMRRLEWVLERAPGNPQAEALLQEARAALQGPMALPEEEHGPPTAIPTALPSPTPGLIFSPEEELARIRVLLGGSANREMWENGVEALIAFQRQFPDYERPETNRLLYDTYLKLGMALITGEGAELGLYYLGLAENLGDLPQEAEDYRLWAGWYLQGIGFYGVNWSIAIDYFADLCLVAPFYQSSCDLLRTARVALADQYAAGGEWCPARNLYQEANAQERTVTVTQKLETAVTNCANATPTPSAITVTLPLTQTQQFFPPPFFVTPRPTAP